jgi:molecular chaperone DnaK (HSP70)
LIFFRLRLDGAANNLINDCLKPIDAVLDKAKLQPDDIKLVIILSLFFAIHFLYFQIVLCGGGTKIPKLRDAIQNKLPSADMLSSINGDEVIALGAARQVNIFSNEDDY